MELMQMLKTPFSEIKNWEGKSKVILVLGVCIQILLFFVLTQNSFWTTSSHLLSFAITHLVLFFVLDKSKLENAQKYFSGGEIIIRYLFIFIMIALMQGGLFHSFQGLISDKLISFTVTTFFTFMLKYIGLYFFILWDRNGHEDKVEATLLSLIATSFVMRLVFLSGPNALQEETYYWQYAQHFAMGYLDHPPMVATIIKLGTLIFGNNEYGVRIPSLLCSLITYYFVFGFARNLLGKKVALISVFLISTLPFFLGSGFFTTPDATLIAAWAGALYFLEKALISNQKISDWVGVGFCIGIGMISKYTIGLLGLSTVIFMLLDKESRKYFLKPGPYVNALLIGICFLPVIVWNAQNDWASFKFQTVRRLDEEDVFSLFKMGKYILIQITPLGLIALIRSFTSRQKIFESSKNFKTISQRQYLFMLIYALVPVSVFVIFSVNHAIRMNWTLPAWIAIVPLFAFQILPEKEALDLPERKIWIPFLSIGLITLAIVFHYLTLGLPGVKFRSKSPKFISWKQMGQAIEKVETQIQQESGEDPLIVCMDTYGCASELSFYMPMFVNKDNKTQLNITSWNYFGGNALMYGWWAKDENHERFKSLLIVSLDPSRLENIKSDKIQKFQLGPIEQIDLKKVGLPAGKIYYRKANKLF